MTRQKSGLLDRIGTLTLPGVGAKAALSALAVGYIAGDASAVISTLSSPQNVNVVNDGLTEYEMHVLGDTSDVDSSPLEIVGSEWDVDVPTYLTITGATLPDGTNNSAGPSSNTADFFFNHLMNSSINSVDSSISGGELADNFRNTDNPSVGPSNVSNGILGIYKFTVNTDAPLGAGSFGLNGIKFTDKDGIQYNVLSNPSVTVQNNDFNVVPEPSSALIYGAVGAALLSRTVGRGFRDLYDKVRE